MTVLEFVEGLSYGTAVMNRFLRSSLAFCFLVLVGCVDNQPFPPGGGLAPSPPPTVLMPVSGTVRERAFVPQIEGVLQRNGLVPVYRGRAEMVLEFTIEEGPVNVDTYIRLIDHGRVAALGQGRASGPPLINRNRVLEDSFFRALTDFERQLGRFGPAPTPRPFR
jgi:hypothetical protein